MFVGGIPFLLTYLREFKYYTIEFVVERTATLLAKLFTKVLRIYTQWVFIINVALLDR